MQNLGQGKFFGVSKKQFLINGLIIVDSSFYHYTDCPWHYHQNAHFAFTTKGRLIETHKKKKIQLSGGCLMYNHSQGPHCNSGYTEGVSALHIDISDDWFKQYNINFSQIEGVHELNDPVLKNVFYTLFKEVKHFDMASPLAIEAMMLQSVAEMMHHRFLQTTTIPSWVFKVKELLYDRYNEELLLQEIASEVNIHPVYLCQQFPEYFHCSFGEYVRKIRIEKGFAINPRKKKVFLNPNCLCLRLC
jgi:AraC family transcriptional regulator